MSASIAFDRVLADDADSGLPLQPGDATGEMQVSALPRALVIVVIIQIL
jgi:hypothetical protein